MKGFVLFLFAVVLSLAACGSESIVGPADNNRAPTPATEPCNPNTQLC